MFAFAYRRAAVAWVAAITLAAIWTPSAQAGTIVVGPTTFDNGGAGYRSGTTDTFLVPRFDDLGGSLTLTKVTLTVKVESRGGKQEFDSEGLSSATITLGIGASVRVKGPDPGLGSRLIVIPDASETLTGFVTADTDGIPADFVGTDSLSITGVFSTDTQSGFRTSALDLAPYIGTGDATYEFDGHTSTKGTSALPDGADRVTFGTTRFDFIVTVTYDFVPEPTSLSLLALGGLVLLRRRR
jgi:hypothetical protein